MLKTSEIQIRDPFIVPVHEENQYYMFGTTDPDCWGMGTGFDAFITSDLENWQGPIAAFRPPAGFWADRNFWAPEVHRYRDRYFMFASFKAEGVCRGTQILAADKPGGPYLLHSDVPVTPRGWECLDGTLFVDPESRPWMVFCHEWVQTGDGTMCAMPLTSDLTAADGDPTLLFHASDAKWARGIGESGDNFVTDGPYLYRTRNGKLLMLWSSVGHEGYAIGVATSESGGILGPWKQEPEPLFGRDGGHGMLFRTFESVLMLSIHSPNNTPDERPLFLTMFEHRDRLCFAI